MVGVETSNTPLVRAVRRNLVAGTIVIALFAVAGALVLQAGRGTGAEVVHAQLEYFAVFTGLSVFFLTAAKYAVSRERVYLPLAAGLLSSSLLDLFEPSLAVISQSALGLAVDPNTPQYAWMFSRLAFGVGLLTAAVAYRSGSLDDRPGRRLASAVGIALVFLVMVVLIVGTQGFPAYYAIRLGPFTALSLPPLLLYLAAAWVLLRSPRPESDGVRTVGLLSLAMAVAVQVLNGVARAPLDGWFFAAHVVKVGSYAVILFGLYLDHIRLYSLERGLRESIETAHVDLKAAKAELDVIIDDLTDGVMVMDESGRVVRFNRAAREIMGAEGTGVRPEASTAEARVFTLEGRTLQAADYPIVRALRKGEHIQGAELVVVRPDGTRRHVVVGAVPLRDARGRVRGAASAFNDVTEIREAEQRFRDLTESAPDGIIVVDERWRIVLFNRAAENLFGFRREEVYGRDISMLVPARDAERFLEARRDNEVAGRTTTSIRPLAVRGLRKDGSELPIEMSMSASGSSGGRFFISHVRDTTGHERLRREREGILSVAQASTASVTIEDYLQRAAHAITEATEFRACTIYVHDAPRHALELRGSAGVPDDVRAQIQRYPLDPTFPAVAVQTWHKRKVVAETHLEGIADYHLTPGLLSKHGFGSLISAPFGDEREPWGVLQVVATPGRHAKHDDLQLIELLAQELTAGLRQKRLIQQLESSTNELRSMNEELDSFIYTASHDLAEPLRSISNFSHFLLEDYAVRLDDEGKDYLQRVHAGALRMKRLLDDLLRLSRHGRSKAPRIRVNVDDVLAEVRDGLDATLRERKAELVVQPKIPDVAADRTSLIEVFINLIGNGIKFNQNEQPRIVVAGERRDGFVEFLVKDNGIGIPPEHHQRIFGLFARLHTRKEYPGTGAGLAIVRKIVENHGGRIWVESTIGEGSSFYFTIPAAPAPAPRLEVAQARAPTA